MPPVGLLLQTIILPPSSSGQRHITVLFSAVTLPHSLNSYMDSICFVHILRSSVGRRRDVSARQDSVTDVAWRRVIAYTLLCDLYFSAPRVIRAWHGSQNLWIL